MEKITILLASNHELWWDGLFLLLKNSQDFEVLDICYDALETINKAKKYKPNIILLDEEIGGGDCGEVAQSINDLNRDIKIIIVIKPFKNVSLSSSFKSLAKAYIDKDITYAEMLSSLHHVAKGGVVVISPFVAQKMLEQVASSEKHEQERRVEYDIGLSKREKEVLAILARRGNSNKEIANALFITENTVKAHLSRIMEKMQVRNRQQASIIARQMGIFTDQEQGSTDNTVSNL